MNFKSFYLEKEIKKKEKDIGKLEAKVEAKENKIRKYMESIDSEVEEQVGEIITQRDEAMEKYELIKSNLEKADARILKLREQNEERKKKCLEADKIVEKAEKSLLKE